MVFLHEKGLQNSEKGLKARRLFSPYLEALD